MKYMQTVPKGRELLVCRPVALHRGGSETRTPRQEVGFSPGRNRAFSCDPVFARVAGSLPRGLCRAEGGKQIRSLICP